MKQKKRWLAGLLAAVLLTALLPATALAAGETADWAAEAAQKLNTIYSTEVFVPLLDEMDVSAAKTTLEKMGSPTDKLDGLDGEENFTRALACEVLADAFALQVPAGKTAIQYLYERNIINGVSENNLAENGSVTYAQFAVLTYRVLNSVGGGLGSETNLQPGTDAYYAWMYLAVRKCAPFTTADGDKQIKDVTGFKTYQSSALKEGYTDIYEVTQDTVAGEAIWTAWGNALKDENIGGDSRFTPPTYNGSETLFAAATRMVNAFFNKETTVVFHDVSPSDWYYDGVMYFADRQIVIGYGDGQFGPEDPTIRNDFATLLWRIAGSPTIEGVSGWPISQQTYVTQNGYMTPPEDNENAWWGTYTTREDAVVAILKFLEKTEGIVAHSENTAILQRFADNASVSEVAKPYWAYAVSHGMVNGIDNSGSLELQPQTRVSRAQLCVLFYRTLIGLDASKIQDYRENVQYVLGGN